MTSIKESSATQFTLPALELVEVSRFSRWMGSLMLVLLVATPIGLVCVPWVQTIAGTGQVVAFDPQEREMTIDAPLSGRIVKWFILNEDGLRGEGVHVKKGDPILEMQDLDENLVRRLEDQRLFIENKLAASLLIVDAYERQVTAYEESGQLYVSAAENHIEVAAQKQQAASRDVEAQQAALNQSLENFQRQRSLAKEGLVSSLTAEVAERKYKEDSAKLESLKNYLQAAHNEWLAKQKDKRRAEQEAMAKIDSSRAQRDKALGEVESIRKELTDLDVKISRQRSQVVVAPRAGTILRVIGNEYSQQFKAGDPLAILVPDTDRRAVELLVNGNDAPLVIPGSRVRLQFEGWPAVQFAGWPSVAVGTFGGRVKFVDASDNGKGKFRVIVVPDENDNWPRHHPYADSDLDVLRQGVRANGWILLSQVPLGWEFWRQLNGFPPAIGSDGAKSKAEDKILKKLVK